MPGSFRSAIRQKPAPGMAVRALNLDAGGRFAGVGLRRDPQPVVDVPDAADFLGEVFGEPLLPPAVHGALEGDLPVLDPDGAPHLVRDLRER